MDKGRKLRRYSRKDYSQLVDFPVEIVGRDGVVRRYSFEESVRLYQRRIASAGLRYDDGEVVRAEVQHCRRRIDQLRRSYFVRYGWSSIKVVGSLGAHAAGLSGEVAAFLRRCFDGSDLDPESTEFAFLQEAEQHQVYFVRHHGGDDESGDDPSYLLYLYRFEQSAADCPSRDAFLSFLKVLQGVRDAGEGIEALLAYHHTADFGLVLTGRPGDQRVRFDPGSGGDLDMSWLEDEPVEADPLHQGMMMLRRGERLGAFRRFVAAYEANHYRRAAYIGAAVVADQLGRHSDAETAALMGTRYFPSNPLLHYHLALARVRRGDASGAREPLQVAEALVGEVMPVAVLKASIDLIEGRIGRGRRVLGQARRRWGREDPELTSAIRQLQALVSARSILIGGAVGLVLLGLLVAVVTSPWAGVVAVVGLLVVPAMHTAWRRQLARLLAAPGQEGLRLANPAALRAAAAEVEDLQ